MPINKRSRVQLSREIKDEDNLFEYLPLTYETSQFHDSYTSLDLPLTKSTGAPNYPTSVINPHEFYGGFVNPPTRRDGRVNTIKRFPDQQDRIERKSPRYIYRQDKTVDEEDADVEEIVEDNFLEEGEYLSTGEAETAFKEESGSNPSLFSPDAPYDTEDRNNIETVPQTNSYQKDVEEKEKEEPPKSESPKEITRYKSTSSINKYKSQFEIKQSSQPAKLNVKQRNSSNCFAVIY